MRTRTTGLVHVAPSATHVLNECVTQKTRPEQPAIVDQLTSAMEFYGARHCVRPGITGWAQVNHGYGGTELDVMEKLQYDFFYIRNQSLRLDLRILAATARTIATGRGL